MSRDMRNNRRSAPPRQGNSLLVGIVIGALIGVCIAVGVALFLNRSPSPFNRASTASTPPDAVASAVKPQQNNNPEIMHPNGSSAVNALPDATASQPASPAPAPTPTASAPKDINYDFYKVLSGNEDKNAKKTTDKASEGTKPSVADNKPASAQKSYLQVGAFQSAQQADNLKARLALVGVEARIQSKDTGNGVLYRVRVGPFASQEELNHMRSQLKQNGIDSTIVNG